MKLKIAGKKFGRLLVLEEQKEGGCCYDRQPYFLFVLKGEMIKYKHWLISKISDAYKLYSDKEWGKLEKDLKEVDKQAKQRGRRYE